MIKIITKQLIAALALFAVAGTASAAIPDPVPYLFSIPGVIAAGSPNITSTGGSFTYKAPKGSKAAKMTYKAKGSKGGITLEGVTGFGTIDLLSSLPINKGSVEVKKGTITIKGIDPLGTSNKKVTLVTATYNESFGPGNFAIFGDLDVFGMNIGNIKCPLWEAFDFCTDNESFYVTAFDFGSDSKKIKVKGSKNGGATAVTTIPVPAAVWLFASGLIGLVGVARRRKHS